MSQHQPRRLGALSDKWDVPPPQQLEVLLEPDQEAKGLFYESDLGFPADGGSEGTAVSRVSDRERLPRVQFEVFSDAEGEHRWRLRQNGSNGVLAESATSYPSRASCYEAIRLMRSLGLRARVKERT